MISKKEPIIILVDGHYEMYYDGQFICSGDTYRECYKEWENLINEKE